jgi:hypothetical protein
MSKDDTILVTVANGLLENTSYLLLLLIYNIIAFTYKEL